MGHILTTGGIGLIVGILLTVFKSRPLPSRETIIKPNEERVILLGASSGVGRDLALVYARRGAKLRDTLEEVKAECADLGAGEVLLVAGDITSPEDLLAVRQATVDGFDTLHILAGVPSTSTLLDIAGAPLERSSSASTNPTATKSFANDTDLQGIERVKAEAQACADINFLGTTLALATFLPTLSRSRSPVLHHLSSVAATIPAPRRTLYAGTKAAGLHAFESCRVECEGSGVRFLSIAPGTIDNDFRQKHALDGREGACEVKGGVKHSWEGLLLSPQKVVEVIMENISLNPTPAPLIPYFPFNLFSSLNVPPKHLVHLPWQYRAAFMLRDTPLAWLYLEKAARKKYDL